MSSFLRFSPFINNHVVNWISANIGFKYSNQTKVFVHYIIPHTNSAKLDLSGREKYSNSKSYEESDLRFEIFKFELVIVEDF